MTIRCDTSEYTPIRGNTRQYMQIREKVYRGVAVGYSRVSFRITRCRSYRFSSCIAMYYPVLLCIAIRDVSRCITLYRYVLLRIRYVLLGIAIYYPVTCIAMYCHVLPCIVMYSLCIAMYYNVFCSGYMTPCVAIHDTHVSADRHMTPPRFTGPIPVSVWYFAVF